VFHTASAPVPRTDRVPRSHSSSTTQGRRLTTTQFCRGDSAFAGPATRGGFDDACRRPVPLLEGPRLDARKPRRCQLSETKERGLKMELLARRLHFGVQLFDVSAARLCSSHRSIKTRKCGNSIWERSGCMPQVNFSSPQWSGAARFALIYHAL
jgi:hypothetical protein